MVLYGIADARLSEVVELYPTREKAKSALAEVVFDEPKSGLPLEKRSRQASQGEDLTAATVRPETALVQLSRARDAVEVKGVRVGCLGVFMAVAVATGLWIASSAGGASAVCKPGVTTINGTTARVFCGPAKATVKVGGKTLRFKQGECQKGSQYVSVNIGTVLLGTTKKKPDYFGLNVGRLLGSGKPASKDGTYKGSALALDYGGKGYAVRADKITVTLKGNRSRGSFKATTFEGKPISGSFTC